MPTKKKPKNVIQKSKPKKLEKSFTKKLLSQVKKTARSIQKKITATTSPIAKPSKPVVQKPNVDVKVTKPNTKTLVNTKGNAPGNLISKTQVSAPRATTRVKGLKPTILLNTAVAAGPVCREVACELLATSGGYCRLHYIKNWKKVKRKELILRERKLNQYIEELVSKYPDKYIEAIRQDLTTEKDFLKVISDLEIDEGMDDFELDTEATEGILDNIKRDYEDEGDAF